MTKFMQLAYQLLLQYIHTHMTVWRLVHSIIIQKIVHYTLPTWCVQCKEGSMYLCGVMVTSGYVHLCVRVVVITTTSCTYAPARIIYITVYFLFSFQFLCIPTPISVHWCPQNVVLQEIKSPLLVTVDLTSCTTDTIVLYVFVHLHMHYNNTIRIYYI